MKLIGSLALFAITTSVFAQVVLAETVSANTTCYLELNGTNFVSDCVVTYKDWSNYKGYLRQVDVGVVSHTIEILFSADGKFALSFKGLEGAEKAQYYKMGNQLCWKANSNTLRVCF